MAACASVSRRGLTTDDLKKDDLRPKDTLVEWTLDLARHSKPKRFCRVKNNQCDIPMRTAA